MRENKSLKEWLSSMISEVQWYTERMLKSSLTPTLSLVKIPMLLGNVLPGWFRLASDDLSLNRANSIVASIELSWFNPDDIPIKEI